MSTFKRDIRLVILSVLVASLLTFLIPKSVGQFTPKSAVSLGACEAALNECLNKSKSNCMETYEECVNKAIGAAGALLN